MISLRIKLIISINLLFIKIKNINEEWEKYKLNPVLGNNKTGTLFDPFVLKHENIYKMYVSWRPLKSIALSTSKDGINWSDLKIVLNPGNNNTWESIINRGSIVILNNKFYLWYTGQYKGISKIGLAISENGNNFTKYQKNPVLIPEYEYEKYSVMNPHVIYDNEEKIFKMWYSAGETVEPDVICYATSKNGKNWIKYINNPIFKPNPNISSLDFYKIGGCDVHKISNSKYLMFYIGYTDINTARIFITESKNGINNWKRNYKPIIKPSKNKFDSDSCYKPSAIYDNKRIKWMIWYNGRVKNKEFIGLATYHKYDIYKINNFIKIILNITKTIFPFF